MNNNSLSQNHATDIYIKAMVLATGNVIRVDDMPVSFGFFKCYCPWHNSEDGDIFHDDELEFLEPRLQ